MKYLSTGGGTESVTARQAVMRGLAQDGGLFMPTEIPQLSADFWKSLDRLTFHEIALQLATPYFKEDISDSDLQEIVAASFDFPVPMQELDKNTCVVELFHGPTLAFKDFGARFMARLMSCFQRKQNKELTVLVATSGDTGSAVASGFYRVEGIHVVLLFPKGQVSPLQRLQLTGFGENITALEVAGTFDDCQAMVKRAFLDPDLKDALSLTSANSINIARLIPQAFYYAQALAQPRDPMRPIVFSVPSGNFGNLTAGLLAKKMGLPVAHFVASTNPNDVVPKALRSGTLIPRPSVRTLSNAMDVGNPSNFARMLHLYGNNIQEMKKDLSAVTFTDEETRDAMREAYERCAYILDPHTAVGYLGWRCSQEATDISKDALGIILSTAHPAKFPEVVEDALGVKIDIPERLAAYRGRESRAHSVSNRYEDFKEFLLH